MIPAIRHLLPALLLIAGALDASAQRVTDPNANLWVSHWGDQRFADRWSFHTEAHWRRTNLGRDWQQLLIRPAVSFHLNEQVLFTLGYSYYFNYQYGTYPITFQNREHHLYQQVQLSGQAIGHVRLQHRFRMEERFIAKMKASEDYPLQSELDRYTYQSRFRYRVWLTLPLGHEQVEPGVLTANFYDEVFLNFGDSRRSDYIQQNRVSALLGYQVSKPFSILAGYLYQTIQRPGAAHGADLMELNSTIHLGLVYNGDLRKPKVPVN
ncbi:MAG: DUF2490 domain-containing protein [Flavobacteriales bacterium]